MPTDTLSQADRDALGLLDDPWVQAFLMLANVMRQHRTGRVLDPPDGPPTIHPGRLRSCRDCSGPAGRYPRAAPGPLPSTPLLNQRITKRPTKKERAR